MSLVKSDGSTEIICSANMDVRLGNNKGAGLLEKHKIPRGATKPADGFSKRRVKFFTPVTAETSNMPTAPASPATALGKAESDREKPSPLQERGVWPSSLPEARRIDATLHCHSPWASHCPRTRGPFFKQAWGAPNTCVR
jgi:hypothetical protein